MNVTCSPCLYLQSQELKRADVSYVFAGVNVGRWPGTVEVLTDLVKREAEPPACVPFWPSGKALGW